MATVKDEIADKVKAEIRDQMVTREEAQQMAAEAAASAAQAAVERVLQTIAEQRAGAPGATSAADLLSGLAKAIAEVGNQGTGKVVVDPAILAKRDVARRRMFELIEAARARGASPKYGLTKPVHLADQIILPFYVDNVTHRSIQRFIHWSGVPNEGMEPAEGDAVAQEIHAAFCESIDRPISAPARPGVAGVGVAQRGGRMLNMPGDYRPADLQLVEDDPLVQREIPANSLEVLGGVNGGVPPKTVDVHILGRIVEPAKEMVA